MKILAFLLAALLATSGLTKVRSANRVGLGLTPGTALELLAAVAIAFASIGSLTLPRWLVWGSLLLFLASSVHHVSRLRAQRRSREESEGGRLAAYVKYLSGSDEPQ